MKGQTAKHFFLSPASHGVKRWQIAKESVKRWQNAKLISNGRQWMQLNADVHKYLWDLDPITMWIMQRHPWVLKNTKINSVANRWIDFELWSVDVVEIAKLIWKVQHFWHIGTLLQNSEIKEVENYEIDFEECDVKYNFLHGWVDIIAVSLFADWSSLSNPNKNLTRGRAV